MTVRRPPLLLAVAALAGLTVCVSPAQLAFPGTNGKIAYVSDVDGNGKGEISTINPDGTEETHLTDSTFDDVDPAWSPDGTKIAFARRQATHADLLMMNADGTALTNLTNSSTSFYTDPAWSPGGNAIAFVGPGVNGTDIYRMNADGSSLVNLTNTDHLQEVRPNWSPDGSRIAYDASSGGTDRDVYVMNADGGDPTNLTAAVPEVDEQPSWSPDGTRIAFVTQRDGNDEIYTMNPDGTGSFRVTTHAAADLAPAWSPDGTDLVFQSSRDTIPSGAELYLLGTGSNPQRVVPGQQASAPDWQPLAGSFARLTLACSS